MPLEFDAGGIANGLAESLDGESEDDEPAGETVSASFAIIWACFLACSRQCLNSCFFSEVNSDIWLWVIALCFCTADSRVCCISGGRSGDASSGMFAAGRTI